MYACIYENERGFSREWALQLAQAQHLGNAEQTDRGGTFALWTWGRLNARDHCLTVRAILDSGGGLRYARNR